MVSRNGESNHHILVGSFIRLKAQSQDHVKEFHRLWAIRTARARAEDSVHAHQIRLKTQLAHPVNPELRTLNISNLRTCVEDRTEGDHVELAACTFHLRDPIFGAIRCPRFRTSIDQAIVRLLIWSDSMLLHLHQPTLSLLRAVSSG